MPNGKTKRNKRNTSHRFVHERRDMTSQASTHRRGGTHRVKNEHKTNTIFDEYNYKQLKAECIVRGVYVKDMKKVEMARTLATNEHEKKITERNALVERQKQQKAHAREKEMKDEERLKAHVARHKRRLEKTARRDRDESVSDDTPDEEALQKMHNEMLGLDFDDESQGAVGQALSEESWDSTSTETTFNSGNLPIVPDCKLRLFEWNYLYMPSLFPRSSPISSFGPACADPSSGSPFSPIGILVRQPPVPRNVPYVPLKVHTTESKEKMSPPGQTYPPGVDPDYVPVLSQRTRNACHNGILEGVLRKAIIERASTWTNRTLIQGWNARMYFLLPPRNESKKLPEVYRKWYLENRKQLRVKPRSEGIKIDREQRHMQRRKNKAKKVAEVLEASEYRPTAVCYLSAYLDCDAETWKIGCRLEEGERTLENLFFVRFSGCDVPHYHFWTRRDEWADPTMPNYDWHPAMAEDDNTDTGDSGNDDTDQVLQTRRVPQKRLPQSSHMACKFVRVKKSFSTLLSPIFPLSPLSLSTIVSRIENELYTHGLSTTLTIYRTKWVANGKSNVWKAFSRALPLLYPSGQLPIAPPVKAEGVVSIAVKLASIETIGEKTLLYPLKGDEPWTRDDDELWEVVEVGEKDTSIKATKQKDDIYDELEELNPVELQALYRRSSIQASSPRSTDECAAWLEQVSPSPVQEIFESLAGVEREKMFLQSSQRGMDVVCPFCLLHLGAMSFRVCDTLQTKNNRFLTLMQEQAEHMYSHSAARSVPNQNIPLASYSPIVLPPTVRRLSHRINILNKDFFDSGAEADNEKAPRRPRHRSDLRINTRTTRKRRRSEPTCASPNTPSSHILSPYLPNFKRYPENHPNSSQNPKKLRPSSIDSLEYFNTKKRKTKAESPKVVVCKNAEDGDGSLTKFSEHEGA
jgi:hypothetical protein